MMKFTKLFFLVVFLIGFANCEKDKSIGSNLYFSINGDLTDIIVNYDEIIGYDSTKYIFKIKDSAWNRLNDKIKPISPDPKFTINIALDNQIKYTARYVPGYYSSSINDIITFRLWEPGLVYIILGYESGPNSFKGKDLRNDSRILNRLKVDNKLIKIDD